MMGPLTRASVRKAPWFPPPTRTEASRSLVGRFVIRLIAPPRLLRP